MSAGALRSVVVEPAQTNRASLATAPLAAAASVRSWFPALAGVAWVEGACAEVRTADRTIRIDAPKRLLRWVVRECDGTRTPAELLALLPDRQRAEMDRFLTFLRAEGALIDARELALQGLRHARQFSPYGRPDPSDAAPGGCQPGEVGEALAVPLTLDGRLAELLQVRQTCTAFGDQAITASQLGALLWAASGWVAASGGRPRRTVASAGGLHLLEVHVVLGRAVGSYQPGLYRVHYPGPGQVSLFVESTGSQPWHVLPRAFIRPWELAHATGVMVLSARPQAAMARYGNRAVQYLFMEAGAALHNAGLLAAQEQLACATVGGYDEAVLEALLRASDQRLILGTALFGTAPDAKRRAAARAEAALDLQWIDMPASAGETTWPSRSTRHVAVLRLKGSDLPPTWGSDSDPQTAYVKAIAELAERQTLRHARGLVWGTMLSVPHALDPTRCMAFSARQHRRPGFGLSTFAPTQAHWWVAGERLLDAQPVMVLAQLVFSSDCLPSGPVTPMGHEGQVLPHQHSVRVAEATSSGCAAGLTRHDARWRALLELVERDAFMRHWLTQTAGLSIGAHTLGREQWDRIAALQLQGCRVHVQRLDSAWSHVVLVAAQHGRQHFTTVGCAAHPDLKCAIDAALSELEPRVQTWLSGYKGTTRTPRAVRTAQDHFDLYGSPRWYRAADAVLFGRGAHCFAVSAVEAAQPCASVRMPDSLLELTRAMTQAGLSPCAIDLTPGEAPVLQGRHHLHVARVIVPGLLPLNFGWGTEPLGMLTTNTGEVAQAAAAVPRVPHPFP